MPDNTITLLNRIAAFLMERMSQRSVMVAMLVFIGLAYGLAINSTDVTQFSPDSWSYFELSKKIFFRDFYAFNTFRSYFSAHHSAAFPMGYPVALALFQLLAGKAPESAAIFNGLVAVATVYVVIRIADQLALPRIYGIAIAVALALYQPYMDEVFAGRSIPLAVLLFATAGFFYLRENPLYGGFILGLSALVRFDFLVHSIIFILATTLVEKPGHRQSLLLVGGFVVGVLPWVIYSYSHFGIFWASDNSWVAASALPAFVLDYPAAPVISAGENPALWLNRLISNLYPMGRAILGALARFPLLPIMAIFLLLKGKSFYKVVGAKSAALLALALVATAPYVLTGYFDVRYYTIHLLCLSLILASWVNRIEDVDARRVSGSAVAILALFGAFSVGAANFYKAFQGAQMRTSDMRKELEAIESLRKCQQTNPDVTYVFDARSGVSYFRYGALTGMKASGLPSNFSHMSERQKQAFFSFVAPYALIENSSGDGSCPS